MSVSDFSYVFNTFLLTLLYEYSYHIYVIETNTKGQRSNRGPIETLAFFLLGVRDGSRDSFLERARRGFNSPHVQPILQILPASGSSHSRGMSSGMSRRQSWKLPVILALWPEESKGQNDLFELLYFE
jgi:hypothetical protein